MPANLESIENAVKGLQNSIGKIDLKDGVEYLLGDSQLLTATGAQYNVADADAKGTSIQSTETDLYTFSLRGLPSGTIRYLSFGLTVALLQVTGAVNGVYKWYVRQAGTSGWVLIYTSGSIALPAAYDEVGGSCAGKFKPTRPMAYPLDVKLTLNTDGAANMGKLKVNASSYVRILLK